jgi:hypothetical protein
VADDDAPKVVDERFWLARAAKVLEETSDKLDKGGDRIATATAWFWGAYSTAMTAAFALAPQKFSIEMALLAASPALALFVAYGLATWAAVPVPIEFHVLVPADIKLAHEEAIERKRSRLRLSLIFAGFAAVLVVAVGLAFVLREPTESGDIAIALSGDEIVVGGTLPVTSGVLVSVAAEGVPPTSRTVPAKKGATFHVAVPVANAAAYAVEVSWSDGVRITTIRQTVTR